jgi:4-hydroxy-2-oxoheptanedioate aldolase
VSESSSVDSLFRGIKRFRQRIALGERVVGAAVTFNDPLISEVLADSVDFLWYDLEHVGMDRSALTGHLMAARHRGTPGIVRVASVEPATVKPVLDAGAEGIVAAQVTTVDEVERFVSNCRYPPAGRRGAGPRIPTDFYRVSDLSYYDIANESVYVAVMVETAEAVAAIERIVQVEGLDGVVIGPFDLSVALGCRGQFDAQPMAEAIPHVIEVTRAAGRTVGIGMGAAPDFAISMFERGIQWVQMGNDFEYMRHHFDMIREQAMQERVKS